MSIPLIIIAIFTFEYTNVCDSCFDFINREDYNTALKCYENAINKNKKYDACLFYGRAYSNYGLNNLEDAKKDVSEMIKHFGSIEPKIGIANTFFLLSRIYSKENLYEQEIIYLIKSLEAMEKVDILVTLSFALNKVGRFKESVEFATKAITLNPNYAYAYSNRGYSYLMMNHLKEAEKDFDKSYSLNPNNPYLYQYKGLLSLKFNNKLNACENFNKAIKFADKNFDKNSDKKEINLLIEKNCN